MSDYRVWFRLNFPDTCCVINADSKEEAVQKLKDMTVEDLVSIAEDIPSEDDLEIQDIEEESEEDEDGYEDDYVTEEDL